MGEFTKSLLTLLINAPVCRLKRPLIVKAMVKMAAQELQPLF